MSHLRVVTWNAEGMFVADTKTRRATPHDALSVIKKLDADIVVIPEFGRLSDLEDAIETTIRALGYETTTLAYDEPRTPGLGFAILSRLPVVQTTIHELRGSKRQLLEVLCHDERGDKIRVFGVHLDDKSEEGRLKEIASVCEIVGRHPGDHTLVMGDFNAMHRDAWFARVARSSASRHITTHIPHQLMRSMAERVCEMALGTTIEYLLQHTELHDMDPSHRLTISSKQAGLEWMPAWRLAKIDWIFGDQSLHTLRYRVSADVGSDHRPVLAEIEY